MAPSSSNSSILCVTEATANATVTPEDFESSHQALLYIVVTLLFYSIGIIIGIITYLKRERQEIEEDKVFDDLLMLRKNPFQAFRSEQVQAVAARLQMLEERKKAQENGTGDRHNRPNSLKLGLDVKSQFSRSPSPRINYTTCPKCKKSYRTRFGSYVDRVHRSSHKKKHGSADESHRKDIVHECSPEIVIPKLSKTVNTPEHVTHNEDLPTVDVVCSTTPPSIGNMDEVFYTPPDCHPGFSLTQQSEIDCNDEDVKNIDAPLVNSSQYVETKV